MSIVKAGAPDQRRKANKSAIPIERSPELTKAINALSDCIRLLPIPTADINALVDLVLNQMKLSEDEAFEQGYHMGFEHGFDAGDHWEDMI